MSWRGAVNTLSLNLIVTESVMIINLLSPEQFLNYNLLYNARLYMTVISVLDFYPVVIILSFA